MDVDEFRSLKDSLEALDRRLARDEGALEQLTSRLREEFGLDSLDAAEAELARLEREQRKDVSRLERDGAAWGEKYGDLLGG